MARILLVDDEPAILRSLAILLEGDGHSVEAAESGEAAMVVLAEREFDLMISDIRMEPMNGMELAKMAHDTKPSMAVVMLTGYASPGTAAESLKYGVFDYLTKPVPESQLLRTVRGAVELHTAAPAPGDEAKEPEGSGQNESMKEFLRTTEETYFNDTPQRL